MLKGSADSIFVNAFIIYMKTKLWMCLFLLNRLSFHQKEHLRRLKLWQDVLNSIHGEDCFCTRQKQLTTTSLHLISVKSKLPT